MTNTLIQRLQAAIQHMDAAYDALVEGTVTETKSTRVIRLEIGVTRDRLRHRLHLARKKETTCQKT